MRTRKDKKKFLETLEEAPWISIAAKRVGIGRATIYRWEKNSKRFVAAMDSAIERGRRDKCEFAEAKLMQLIQNGHFGALRFFLENNHPLYIKPRHEGDMSNAERIKVEEQTDRLNQLIEAMRNESIRYKSDDALLPPQEPAVTTQLLSPPPSYQESDQCSSSPAPRSEVQPSPQAQEAPASEPPDSPEDS